LLAVASGGLANENYKQIVYQPPSCTVIRIPAADSLDPDLRIDISDFYSNSIRLTLKKIMFDVADLKKRRWFVVFNQCLRYGVPCDKIQELKIFYEKFHRAIEKQETGDDSVSSDGTDVNELVKGHVPVEVHVPIEVHQLDPAPNPDNVSLDPQNPFYEGDPAVLDVPNVEHKLDGPVLIV
jgi:hypothetical protein